MKQIFNTLKPFAFISLAFCIAPAPVFAQQRDLDLAVQDCVDARAASDRGAAAVAARHIQTWRGKAGRWARENGAACLLDITGEPWTFQHDLQQFVADADLVYRRELAAIRADRADQVARFKAEADAERRAAADALASAAQDRDAARAQRLATEVWNACDALYNRQPQAAVLHPVCFDVFTRSGLPDR